MKLKSVKETSTGLNIQFVNQDSGRRMSLDHVIKQIENGNPNYQNYQSVKRSNGTVYVRSKPDNNKTNNIE